MKNITLIISIFFFFINCKKKEEIQPIQQSSLRVVESDPCIDTIFGNKQVTIKQSMCLDPNDPFVQSKFVIKLASGDSTSLIVIVPNNKQSGGSQAIFITNNKFSGFFGVSTIKRAAGIWEYKCYHTSMKDTLTGITYFHNRNYVK
jgi:hypothetical protein